ncbi:MAG: hypothetical protein IVW57_08005 [Ktedonobacterales bacterium]|nr:hypothetical protein [Ktedonobacterales bacterium]
MVTSADALVAGMHLPELPMPPQPLPPGALCAMTGQPLMAGYPLASVIAETTADLASTFPYCGLSPFVAETTARAFRTKLTGNLLVVEAPGGWQGMRPLVSRDNPEAATRPLWCDLLPTLIPGTQTLAILSDDVQRRLWPCAALSRVGPSWTVYLHDQTGSQRRTVNHADLLACLAAVTRWYGAGISKDAMRAGLLTLRGDPARKLLGGATVRAAERELAAWHGSDTWAIALYCAQKPSISEETIPCPPQLPADPPSASPPPPARAGSLWGDC